MAPLVVKDKVILGIAGAEFGIRGFIEAFDAATGKKLWRFYTVAGPMSRAATRGRGPMPTSARRRLDLGDRHLRSRAEPRVLRHRQPGPDYYSANREGDNLYTASIVALDADTGKLKWHYQFTPHDVHDWDATQVPVLGDLPIDGKPRKVVMFANRNGFFYTIDRVTGKLIVAKPFVETTWAKEISSITGRPILLPGNHPNEQGARTCPDLGGGTNFMSPSYDPAHACSSSPRARRARRTSPSIRSSRLACSTWPAGPCGPRPAQLGGAARDRSGDGGTQMGVPLSDDVGIGACCRRRRGSSFAGDGDGNLMAFESRTGKNLWHYQLGSALRSTSGTTYMLDGRQYLLVPSGSMLTAFALPPGTRPECSRAAIQNIISARLRRTSMDRSGAGRLEASRLVAAARRRTAARPARERSAR